jgi:hypothetical protein
MSDAAQVRSARDRVLQFRFAMQSGIPALCQQREPRTVRWIRLGRSNAMLTTFERQPQVRTLRGWAISVLQDAGAIRECEEHGWMQDRADPHAREHAMAIARQARPLTFPRTRPSRLSRMCSAPSATPAPSARMVRSRAYRLALETRQTFAPSLKRGNMRWNFGPPAGSLNDLSTGA